MVSEGLHLLIATVLAVAPATLFAQAFSFSNLAVFHDGDGTTLASRRRHCLSVRHFSCQCNSYNFTSFLMNAHIT